MEALSDLARSVIKLFLIQPFHVGVFGGSLPLLEGPGGAWVEGGHFHDFSGKSRLKPIFEYLCGS